MKKTFKTNGRLLSQVFSSYRDTFEALCELINNSIQAKSTEIKIEADLVDDDPSPHPFTEYRIIDNGEGVSTSEFDRKILEIATDVKGSKGIGRFAAFQIGSIVTIDTIAFDNQTNKYTHTSLILDAKHLVKNDIEEYQFEINNRDLDKTPKNTFYRISIYNFWDDVEKKNNPNKKLIKKLIPGFIEEEIFLKYSSYIVIDKIVFSINGKKLSKEDFLIGKIENDSFNFTFSDEKKEM